MNFYLQMTKLAIIPCTVLLETVFYRKRFRFVLAALDFDAVILRMTSVIIWEAEVHSEELL